MANPKLTCIDITLAVPTSKDDILRRVKEELDKEFQTDVVDQFNRVTVTCDNQKPPRPNPPKKGIKGKK